MSARAVDKEEKKKIILMGALDVFARKGFHSSTVQDVARSAGIGKGTVYEYYRSKEELFHSLIDLVMVEFEERLQSIVSDESDPVEGIVHSFMDMMEGLDEYVKLAPLFVEIMGLAGRGEADDFVLQLQGWLKRYCHLYAPIFRAGQSKGVIARDLDPCVFIRTITAAMDGLLLHYALFLNRKYIQAQKKEMERILRSALRPAGKAMAQKKKAIPTGKKSGDGAKRVSPKRKSAVKNAEKGK